MHDTLIERFDYAHRVGWKEDAFDIRKLYVDRMTWSIFLKNQNATRTWSHVTCTSFGHLTQKVCVHPDSFICSLYYEHLSMFKFLQQRNFWAVIEQERKFIPDKRQQILQITRGLKLFHQPIRLLTTLAVIFVKNG